MNINITTNTIIPWVVVFLMMVYVLGLNFFATHRTIPEPTFDFYSSSEVIVHIENANEADTTDDHLVMGRFNNIIEGNKKTIEATPLATGGYAVPFEVNSPRSAFLYVNDEAIEVFLVPDSTLRVSVVFNDDENKIDALSFQGFTKDICDYYRLKARKFERMHIRSFRNATDSDSLERHAWVLDSLATNELAYLLIRSQPNNLPQWFIQFETNEILYQKAYLKLANAYNREVYPGYLEDLEVNNQNAVFSYYYYLYLRTLINTKNPAMGKQIQDDFQKATFQLSVADTFFHDEVRDVYITSTIFDLLQKEKLKEATTLFDHYKESFSRKKYERFLGKKIREM